MHTCEYSFILNLQKKVFYIHKLHTQDCHFCSRPCDSKLVLSLLCTRLTVNSFPSWLHQRKHCQGVWRLLYWMTIRTSPGWDDKLHVINLPLLYPKPSRVSWWADCERGSLFLGSSCGLLFSRPTGFQEGHGPELDTFDRLGPRASCKRLMTPPSQSPPPRPPLWALIYCCLRPERHSLTRPTLSIVGAH